MALPPFWELEDLLAAGLDRAAALAVMAARRSGPRLVGAGASDPEGQDLLLRFGLSDLTESGYWQKREARERRS